MKFRLAVRTSTCVPKNWGATWNTSGHNHRNNLEADIYRKLQRLGEEAVTMADAKSMRKATAGLKQPPETLPAL